MAACPEYDELLTLHAAGALEADAQARVCSHLEACAGCRAEATSTLEVLGLLAPPAPTARELAVVESLPRRTLATWRREQVRKAARMQWVGALLAAAAVVMLVLVPSAKRRGPARTVTPVPVAAPATPEPTDEALEAFDAWATGDPLADALQEGALGDEDVDEEWNSNLGELL
jgi:predicted anti-sigma-YlaC factor YlaD